MTLLLLQFATGLLFLFVGGELLVRGAQALASRLGVSPLVIGLTVVAFGTSMPELVVSLDAALAGSSDISLGNVVGSNIANIALILGLAALIHPVRVEGKIARLDAPLVAAVTLLLLLLLVDGILGRWEGALFVTGLLLYLGLTLWQESRRERSGEELTLQVQASASRHGLLSTSQILGGLALLVAGGHLVVTGAVGVAATMGISEAVIGLTVVAVGTSLPELSTTVVAAVRRQGDIAVGNVVGSNLFNVLGILGITALVTPLSLGALGWLDLLVMLGLILLLWVLLILRGGLRRLDGVILLSCYLIYSASLFMW